MRFSWRQLDKEVATYSEDESDGSHAGGGHDFGTVGDQVEQDGDSGLGRVVEAAAQYCRQVAAWSRVGGERSVTVLSWTLYTPAAQKNPFSFSPQGDAGLADHLRAQVLGGELERSLHQPQLLQEAIEFSSAGQQERAHLLQLE